MEKIFKNDHNQWLFEIVISSLIMAFIVFSSFAGAVFIYGLLLYNFSLLGGVFAAIILIGVVNLLFHTSGLAVVKKEYYLVVSVAVGLLWPMIFWALFYAIRDSYKNPKRS